MNKFLLFSLSICAMVWGISDAFLRYSNKTFTDAEIQKMFEPITSRYGIRIVYKIGDDFLSDVFDPVIAERPNLESNILPIRHRLITRYPDILQRAFARYPDKVIKSNVYAVYLAGEIKLGGFNLGGTYDQFRKIVYLVDNGRQSIDTVLSKFHHEFSSLLLEDSSFPILSWKNRNPQEFIYLYETPKDHLATYNNTSLDGSENDYEKGFMNSYGQTDFENDFNTYSGMIFTYPEKFKKILSEYPRVREKFKIWLEFYHQIDPIFTEEYLLGDQYKKSCAGNFSP